MTEGVTALRRVAKKEFRGFFAGPAAYLFIGGFLLACLFSVFWVETFFARNIADVRPLFQWLPLLLIFLVAALTMRSWSEERRSGTLESLLTTPVPPWALVGGKFFAALGLVALAVVLTLPLPVTVSLMGPLDWGPVIGGYIATLFLAGAYVAIGLTMSSYTDNPVVALILTTLVCLLFYLIGSEALTSLMGHQIGGVLAALGTGSRFESITRGVLDIRDIYYYLSLIGVFVALNVFSLERLRWAGNPGSRRHRQWGWLTGLTALNLVAANLWLTPVDWARVDMTADNRYSLSQATAQQLDRLREPLVIRGYFSSKTHPLLAPLVPRIKDLLAEYAALGDDRVRVEFVDPTRDREAEEEAASRYGIRPVPFQTSDRYQASVVSSYFDLVIAYGDEYQTLGYQDLIEIKAQGETDLDVGLKNPEYAITGAIRKVANAYRSGGNPFDQLKQPVTFTAYASPTPQLPDVLQQLREDLETVLDDLDEQAGDKLKVSFVDPDAGDGAVAARLQEEFGLSPQVASLLDPQPFWFYMMLEGNGQTVQVPLPETLDKAALSRSVEAAVKRLAPGFMKTVAVVKPSSAVGGPGGSWRQLEQILRENVRVINEDITDGTVASAADLLLVLAPASLNDKQRFAIDQFLMQGGSVVVATSPFDVQVAGSLTAGKHQSGLEDWLAHHGVDIASSMVLDPRSASLPIPVNRNIGGLTIRDYQMVPYAYFPDLRGDSLNPDNPMTASLGQLTVNWASPIEVDKEKAGDRRIIRLLNSSAESWTSDSLDVVPDFGRYPDSGFASGEQRGSQVLAIAMEGGFDSYFVGKPSPLIASAEPEENTGSDSAPAAGESGVETDVEAEKPVVSGVIGESPASARLVVIASNSFASDASLQLASQGLNTMYTKPLDFVQNAVDWSLEDRDLLSLRGQSQLARILAPMNESTQRFWEYLNYALALVGLALVWLWRKSVRAADRSRYQQILAEV